MRRPNDARYWHAHWKSQRRLTHLFWRHVEPHASGCWVWTGRVNRGGYGVYGRSALWGSSVAHRILYETVFGRVSPSLQLDHLCRRKSCVNPSHLEPVTGAENMRRYALARAADNTCKRGHPRSPENVYQRPDGSRVCRPCQRHLDRVRFPATPLLVTGFSEQPPSNPFDF